MAVLGSIVLGMTTKTEKFEAGVAKSERSLKGFAVQVGHAAKAVAHFAAGAGVAGIGVATAMGALGLSAGKALADVGKVADRLGTTTAKFSELSYATKRTRSDVDALGPALERLKINLSDATTQSGPVRDALTQLGLSAHTLDAMDTSDAFTTIAGGLAQIHDEGQRAQLAMRLMGTEVAPLLNTLSAGSDTIARHAAEFRKLGGSVSELGRNQVADALDAFDRVRAQIEGVGAAIAVKLAPFVEAAIDKFIELTTAGDGWAANVGSAIDFTLAKFASLLDFLQVFEPIFRLVKAGLNGIGKALMFLARLIGQVVTQVNEFFGILNSNEKWSETLLKGFDEIQKKAETTAPLKGFDAIRKKSEETAKSVERVGNAVVKTAARFSESSGLFEQTRTPLEKYRMEIERIDTLLKAGAISRDVARRAKVQAGIASGQNEAKFSGALTLHSTEARSAILQANSRDRFGLGDMQKATAATAAFTRDSAVSLRTLVQKANTQAQPVELRFN